MTYADEHSIQVGDERWLKWAKVSILVAIFAVVLVIGGWQLGWWLKSSATSRNAAIVQRSYGAQLADVQQVQTDQEQVSAIDVQLTTAPASETAALKVQRQAIVNQACSVYVLIANPPPTEATFAAANC